MHGISTSPQNCLFIIICWKKPKTKVKAWRAATRIRTLDHLSLQNVIDPTLLEADPPWIFALSKESYLKKVRFKYFENDSEHF